MSSGTANFGRIDFDDLQWERRRYRPGASYAQSKLANLMFTRQLAAHADAYGWPLLSTAAHPGFTRTNLQTAGRELGPDRPSLTSRLAAVGRLLPSQGVEPGAEPLLYAATGPEAAQGAYYGPTGRFQLVGPAGPARITRRALDPAANARLWTASERLTGVRLADCAAAAPHGTAGRRPTA
ncbi:hypothetical protein AB0910_23075 [Streptomyces sp. NPDC047002]|uniref:hypothetical protein n=1 Tax=Streptomyces sp. NPDC047002 TaxID=3155475 RepID=UPI00345211D6